MVFLGVALLTVSTLAIYISNTAAAGPFVVHPECEGKAFCHIKPDNYPQEEIDRLVIKNLHHLHRMKRSAPALTPSLADPDKGAGNCATKPTVMKTPFHINSTVINNTALHFIVQSRWFQQTIPEVSCSNEGSSCFDSLTLPMLGKTAVCMEKVVPLNVVIYNTELKALENLTTQIEVDCKCNIP